MTVEALKAASSLPPNSSALMIDFNQTNQPHNRIAVQLRELNRPNQPDNRQYLSIVLQSTKNDNRKKKTKKKYEQIVPLYLHKLTHKKIDRRDVLTEDLITTIKMAFRKREDSRMFILSIPSTRPRLHPAIHPLKC